MAECFFACRPISIVAAPSLRGAVSDEAIQKWRVQTGTPAWIASAKPRNDGIWAMIGGKV